MEGHALFRSAVLDVAARGGLGGGTAEVRDGTGAALAVSDAEGTITDATGAMLLHAPIRFEGDRRHGTNAMLTVTGPQGSLLGEVRVQKYAVTPRSRRATLSVTAAGAEVARVEPEDGQVSGLSAAGRPVGTLHRGSKRGLFRSTTGYRLELTGALDERLRRLLVAAAVRYDALVTVAAGAGSGR